MIDAAKSRLAHCVFNGLQNMYSTQFLKLPITLIPPPQQTTKSRKKKLPGFHYHASTTYSPSNKMASSSPTNTPARRRPSVHGLSLTPSTQCEHYHSPLDIIAIKHFCCRKFYACITCHDALETHKSGVWPRDQRDEKAVLCGACGHVLGVGEYMASGSRCTECEAGFNPGCKGHWKLYFEV